MPRTLKLEKNADFEAFLEELNTNEPQITELDISELGKMLTDEHISELTGAISNMEPPTIRIVNLKNTNLTEGKLKEFSDTIPGSVINDIIIDQEYNNLTNAKILKNRLEKQKQILSELSEPKPAVSFTQKSIETSEQIFNVTSSKTTKPQSEPSVKKGAFIEKKEERFKPTEKPEEDTISPVVLTPAKKSNIALGKAESHVFIEKGHFRYDDLLINAETIERIKKLCAKRTNLKIKRFYNRFDPNKPEDSRKPGNERKDMLELSNTFDPIKLQKN